MEGLPIALEEGEGPQGTRGAEWLEWADCAGRSRSGLKELAVMVRPGVEEVKALGGERAPPAMGSGGLRCGEGVTSLAF